MPIYDVLCESCQKQSTVWRRISERDEDLPVCCGFPTHRIVTAVAVRPEIPAYVSPASGKVIESRAQRRDDLRRTGHIEWEPGIREHVQQKRAEAFEKTHDFVAQKIDETVRDLHTSGRLQ